MPDSLIAKHEAQPLAAKDASRFPSYLTNFIGRKSELEALRNTLEPPGVRLLTLTGPEGGAVRPV